MTDMTYTTDPAPMHGGIKYRDDYIGMRFGKLTVIGYPIRYGKRSASIKVLL